MANASQTAQSLSASPNSLNVNEFESSQLLQLNVNSNALNQTPNATSDEAIDPAFFGENQYEEDEFGNEVSHSDDPEKEKAHRQAEALKKKEEEKALPKATLRELFQFCNTTDIILLILSTLGSIAQGATIPMMSLYMGNLVDDLNGTNPNIDYDGKIRNFVVFMFLMAIASAFGGFLGIGGFIYVSERQAKRLRNRYLRAMLRQDISWYDSAFLGDVASRLTAYSRKFQDGVNDKFSICISNLTCFVIGLIVAFYRGWELSLVILAATPVMMFASALSAKMIGDASSDELGAYATANSVALQAFDSIRTVVTYRMEQFLLDKYKKYSKLSYVEGKKKGLWTGIGTGLFFGMIFLMYALGLWYGALLRKQGKHTWPGGEVYTGGVVWSIFYALFMGCMMLGESAQHFASIASAQSALGSILEIINRETEINPYRNSAENLDKLQLTRTAFTGGISFQKVNFRYPTRREALVLDSFTYTFEPYSSFALVGHSGCGKTSLMQLIERFYDPDDGNIFVEIDLDQLDRTLEDNVSFDPKTYASRYPDIPTATSYQLHQTFRDGAVAHTNPRANTHPLPPNTCWVNLKDLSVSLWRRECIGLVNQQPVLFNGTIIENLRYGRPDATQEEVEEVAKRCNAHDFIIAKARGYQTNVGENGSLLSGGQKQRLSLARTLMVQKTLVLFDEITAQVDSISERQIQKTLDELLASKAFSSISIAHRLSTIRNSDQIIVMKDGKIVETGTHDELVEIGQGGVYFAMTTTNNNTAGAAGAGVGAAADSKQDHDVTDEDVRRMEAREADPDQQSDDFEDDFGEGNEIDETTALVAEAGVDSAYQLNRQHNDSENDPRSIEDHGLPYEDPLLAFGRGSHSTKHDFDLHQPKADQFKNVMPKGYLRRFMKQFWTSGWNWIIAAFIWGSGQGAAMPIYAIFLAKIMAFFYLDDLDEMYRKVSQFSGWFVLLAFGVALCAFLKVVFLTIPSERLVLWFRLKVFENLVHQEVGFHDQEENSSSILSTKLAADTGQTRELGVGLLGQVICLSVNIIVSVAVSFTYSWQMTLAMLLIFPVLAACTIVQWRLMSGFGSKSKDHIEKAGLIAVEGLRNIRVVASFNAEELLYSRFASKQAQIVRIGTRSALLAGLGFGVTQFFMYASYAFAFWIGARFVSKGQVSFQNMFASYLLVEGASTMCGQLLTQIVAIDKARASFVDLYQLIDRRSLYDCREEQGEEHPIPHGKLEFKKVQFHYPTAPLLPVLTDVSFVADPSTAPNGECYVMGLIGNSGGGKSTITTLLPRFYCTIQRGGDENLVIPRDGTPQAEIDRREEAYQKHKVELEKKLKKRLNLGPRDPAAAGQVLLDGHNIDSFKLSWLRKHVALVSQEPVLFHGTIRENITAGDPTITEEDMIKAAQVAHIDHVIKKLPRGYDTILTSSNSLSGGQKARVCCARALARKDLRIIVFDEFTSALDVNSSRIILNNLKATMRGKMLIFIAHRLETVANAQKILVLQDGLIAENGSHDELYAKDGIYANLFRLQQ